MEYSIRTEHLTKSFGAFTAVDHIDVAVEKGEVFGFLGANGAGKTTAIRMLCGLLAPTSGRGTVAGFDIIAETAKIRTRIGYMSQKFSLYPDLSVAENLRLYGGLYGLGGGELKDRIKEMAGFLGLGDLLPRITGSLPWGWQQRLSLACANLHRPEILFLDEPTGSVDPVSRRNFWDLIHRLSAQGTTIFITSHYMDEVEYCHRLSIMIEGRIAAIGSPRDLKREHGCATIHDLFLRLMERKSDGSPA
ncbi:MAG: transporter-related protein [Fibrobacteres bacterium]|nr:transporter-related protein [Fibrobacterota bacterium]